MTRVGCSASLCLATFCSSAEAYIGPGMAVGSAALIIGLVIAFMMLIVGLVWYPIKRLRNAMRQNLPKTQHVETQTPRREADK